MPRYEIRVRGHLRPDWSDWLEGMTINHEPDGTTRLQGPIPDQAALYGVLLKLRDLGVALLTVKPLRPVERESRSPTCPSAPNALSKS
jgi:hypothetical protein